MQPAYTPEERREWESKLEVVRILKRTPARTEGIVRFQGTLPPRNVLIAAVDHWAEYNFGGVVSDVRPGRIDPRNSYVHVAVYTD